MTADVMPEPPPRDHAIPKLIYISALIAAATIAAYWGVWHYKFIGVDDPYYVFDEPMITGGLSLNGISWAFTTFNAENFHPLTWMSHQLDCQLFGVNAGPHHAVNLAFHIANSILLLVLMYRMTGAIWRGAFIAAVFALHPLHVESVAWVAERKDVLSTFLAMLTLLAYVGYVRNASTRRYTLVFVLYALDLLAKPMVVTLPCVMLLLDFWPLGRTKFWRRPDARPDAEIATVGELVLEKVPLFAVTLVGCVMTFIAQSHGGAVASVDHTPILARALNALMAYGRYIWKAILPQRLGFFYPYSGAFDLMHLAICAAILIGGSILALRQLKQRPWLAVGWFWFVGMLVPVVGIVQVGGQSIADRYMYLPMIGLLIIVAWGAADAIHQWPMLRPAIVTAAIVAITAFAIGTYKQSRFWKDSIALGQRTLDVTNQDNFFAHVLVGSGYAEVANWNPAIEEFQTAERLRPGHYGPIIDDLIARRDRRTVQGILLR